jgi:secretion/DNA translocation related TadE-like protein
MRTTSERGAATLVMLGVLAVVVTLAVAGMIIGGYVVAVHRARAAADLAALSGAAEFVRGGAPCPAVRRATGENQAMLVDCDQVGDQLDFVITARVRVAIGRTVPGLPRSVEAVAYAGAESE